MNERGELDATRKSGRIVRRDGGSAEECQDVGISENRKGQKYQLLHVDVVLVMNNELLTVHWACRGRCEVMRNMRQTGVNLGTRDGHDRPRRLQILWNRRMKLGRHAAWCARQDNLRGAKVER